jgi:serine/threonine protein phosphatase 1
MIYAIGDLHGERWKLESLLSLLDLSEQDQLVFIGDYIDRGPDSAGVIDHLIALRQDRPNTVFLRGNHEQMMIFARSSYDQGWSTTEAPAYVSRLWFAEGGAQTLASYNVRSEQEATGRWWEMIPEEHWQFVSSTTLEYESEQFLFVHAGILPNGTHWEGDALQADPRLWIREPFLSWKEPFEKVVVFGHTPLRKPLVEANKIGIDTGAVFGGKLTCAALDDSSPFDPRKIHLIQV